MVVRGPPTGGIRFELDRLSVRWGRGSRAGERMVVSLHARVSNHESGHRCSFLKTSDMTDTWGWGAATGGEEASVRRVW
jgi:hypothetical protein